MPFERRENSYFVVLADYGFCAATKYHEPGFQIQITSDLEMQIISEFCRD